MKPDDYGPYLADPRDPRNEPDEEWLDEDGAREQAEFEWLNTPQSVSECIANLTYEDMQPVDVPAIVAADDFCFDPHKYSSGTLLIVALSSTAPHADRIAALNRLAEIVRDDLAGLIDERAAELLRDQERAAERQREEYEGERA